MAKNVHMNNAKAAKNDEFYTLLTDIEKECYHYKDQFKDKVIYCNCDDKDSNFVKYFIMNFDIFEIKKLVATCYHENQTGELLTYTKNNLQITPLNGDGSFDSVECIDILKNCDMVVTNPPFSKLLEYILLLIKYNTKFLIIGHNNAIKYKDIFPLIKENKI